MEYIFTKAGRPKMAVAFLRVTLGILFGIAAWHKIPVLHADPPWVDRMLGFINFQKNTYAWWQGILDSVVIPNADFFAYLTAYGEAAIALGLIFGALTRPAIVFALIFTFSMMFTKGVAFWTPSSNDTLYVLALVTLFFMKPGEAYGLDPYLKRKFPKLPL